MEHERSELPPYPIELPPETIRDSEDIKSIHDGEESAITESKETIAALEQKGQRGEAHAEQDLMHVEMVKKRVIEEFGNATREEIVEAFRERNEYFKDKLALFMEPVNHYNQEDTEIDHSSLVELNTTRKNLGLLWTELETLKWLAGNNNARVEFRFQSGAGRVADTAHEVPPDMQ